MMVKMMKELGRRMDTQSKKLLLKKIFLLCFITGYWIQFLTLYSRTLFAHSICNSLHLTSTDSKVPIHPSPILPRPCNHKSVLYVCESVLWINSFVSFLLIYLLTGPYEASLHTKLVEVMAFQLSYFKSYKMMLWKSCTQCASKFGRLSSGHRTGKGQFSFQS